MPTHFIEEDLRTISPEEVTEERLIEDMARHYKVSAQAMGIRLATLGYI